MLLESPNVSSFPYPSLGKTYQALLINSGWEPEDDEEEVVVAQSQAGDDWQDIVRR